MSLSGGQKQRVAIASAIASKRSILFFDEPTSGLDYKHMKEVANVLRQVRDTGITVYVITHDLELILDCCTAVSYTHLRWRKQYFLHLFIYLPNLYPQMLVDSFLIMCVPE